jgi:hypothetical protein
METRHPMAPARGALDQADKAASDVRPKIRFADKPPTEISMGVMAKSAARRCRIELDEFIRILDLPQLLRGVARCTESVRMGPFATSTAE